MSNRDPFQPFRSNFADGTLMRQVKAAAVAAAPSTGAVTVSLLSTPTDLEPMRLSDFDDHYGTFTGYLSVFNVADFEAETVATGAFSKTLANARALAKARGNSDILWPLLWQHDFNTPIGGILDAEEDDYGLKIWAYLDLNIPEAQQAYSGLKRGYIDGLSMGYNTVKERWQGGRRVVQEIELMEGSVVTFPANPEARVLSVKGRSTASIQHERVVDVVQEAVSVVEEVTRKDREKRASSLAASDATAEVKRRLAHLTVADIGLSEDWMWQEEYERAYKARLKLLEMEAELDRIIAKSPADTDTPAVVRTGRKAWPSTRGGQPIDVAKMREHSLAVYRQYGVDVAELRRAARKVRFEDVLHAMHPRAYR